MNSWRTFNKLILLLGLVLLAGAGLVARRLGAVTPQTAQINQAERDDDEPGATNPDGALRFRRLQLQDEKGDIPADGLVKARQQVKLMKVAQQRRLARQQKSGKAEQKAPEAGIAPDSWNWLGPGNVGGRIRSIVIHPSNPSNMWVGSVGGGIWRTTDAGNSWSPVNDFLANLAVTTMVINPANTNIMYAGTGEGFSNFDAIQGAGIFKSTDGGVTWNQLPATANNNFFFVNRLAISPDGSTLLAATSRVRDVTGTLTVQLGGIWQSIDAGISWSRQSSTEAMDIDFRPNVSTRAIVGELGSAQFLFNGTWAPATFNPPISNGGTSGTNARVELAYAPIGGLIVYASV